MFIKFINRQFLVIFLPAVFLALVFLQPFWAMQNFGPVYDEVAHLPAGYSYLKTGEIVLDISHPPFTKIFAALPLLFLNPSFPKMTLESTEWHTWNFGKQFLFTNNADQLLFWGRILTILLSVLLAFFVFLWTRELFGFEAGVVALFLYTFMPNITAHSQFVTTDLGIATFTFTTLYWLWKFFQKSQNRNLVFCGISLGLALATKFSGIFLIPIILIYALLKISKIKEEPNHKILKSGLKILLPIFFLALAVVYACYFFPSNPFFYLEDLKMVGSLENATPGYYYYLNGSFSQNGWWYYFLEVFLIKTPIPFLIFLFISLFFFKKYSLEAAEKILIWFTVFIFLFVTSWKARNIGVRYLLPIYPFLILWVSGLAKVFMDNSFKLALASFKKYFLVFVSLILGIWYMSSSVLTYPDYLAYFNELVGGSTNGYQYLDDSNIHWYQDVKRLADYQKLYPDTKVVYAGNVIDLNYYSIRNNLLETKENWWSSPRGRFAVDINFLIRAKILSRLRGDPSLNWLDLYRPVEKIGPSFFVYKF